MKKILLLTILALLLASCGTSNQTTTPTASPIVLIPTSSPITASTDTSAPPAATFTPTIITGTLKARVNVRSGPGTWYDSLGLLDSGQTVQIFAQNEDGTWFQIAFSPSSSGSGWISAQFVDTGGLSIPTFTPQVTPTVSGPTGTVSQRINVRSGPGSSYASLGILEANTIIALMGKNATGSWLQIQYPIGTTGRGWVSVEYVKVTGTTGLPVLDAAGTPITPGASTTIPEFTPTATVGPALGDMDTSASPVAHIKFSASGTRKFFYTGDVSTPDGDPEDWIEFTAYATSGSASATLFTSLTCHGNGTLIVELWQNGKPLSGWGSLACSDIGRNLVVTPGIPYLLRMRAAPGNGLQYVEYTLTIKEWYRTSDESPQ
jgi:uncharacterized protein YraI